MLETHEGGMLETHEGGMPRIAGTCLRIQLYYMIRVTHENTSTIQHSGPMSLARNEGAFGNSGAWGSDSSPCRGQTANCGAI